VVSSFKRQVCLAIVVLVKIPRRSGGGGRLPKQSCGRRVSSIFLEHGSILGQPPNKSLKRWQSVI
jgi:hypothetical protein